MIKRMLARLSSQEFYSPQEIYGLPTRSKVALRSPRCSVSELLDGLASGTTPDTRHGFHHEEGRSLSFFVGPPGSRVASGVVSQKMHFTFMPQADVPVLKITLYLSLNFSVAYKNARIIRAVY